MTTGGGSVPAFRVLALDDVGSTNTYGLDLASRGETGPLWLTARRQTRGRGRSGRQWASVDGNLYASLLLTLACPPAAVPQLSLLAGVAVFDAISSAARDAGAVVSGLRLKWPNDVMVGAAKVAGILPESTARATGALTVIIGTGINLVGVPDGLDAVATHLAAHDISVTPDGMVAHHLHPAFMALLTTWDEGRDFAAIRRAWLDRAGAVGEAMTINAGAGRVAGTFGGLDPEGALLLRDADGSIRKFSYGDVTVTAPADSQTGDGET